MSQTFSNAFMAEEKNRELIKEMLWGPNAIRQAEELASYFEITKEMKILDLGAGVGLSSLYLVQKHEVNVFVTDLYADPTDNYERFKQINIEDKTLPMTLDARQPMPFAHGYFDVIFSVGAYNMFGDNEAFIPNILPYVKKGGYIAASFPGLKADFGDNIPEEMKPYWEVAEVAKHVRGLDWWRNIFEKAQGIEIITLSEQNCHDIAWEEYLSTLNPEDGEELGGKWTLDMKKAEAGKYYNTIQLVAKVK